MVFENVNDPVLDDPTTVDDSKLNCNPKTAEVDFDIVLTDNNYQV